MFRHFLLLTCWLRYGCGEAGAEDCETTVIMSNVNNSLVYVPSNGTVCFDCSGIDIIFAVDINFIISEKVNKSSYTITKEMTSGGKLELYGTLVVNDSEKAFSTSSAEIVKCCEVQYMECLRLLFHTNVLRYHTFSEPEISGETTVAEGDALDLVCDGSNSDPQPTLQWLSPAGEKISDSGQLVISNTNRTMTGLYTCVATLPNSTMSLNTTVNVSIVYCEAVQSTELIIVNMTSTAMSSIATYQCRDGHTDDVYTTQCTSVGVWDPHPLSHLNCTVPSVQESLLELYGGWLFRGLVAALILLLCCCFTTCAVIVWCVCKRNKRKRKRCLLTEHSGIVSDRQQRMTVLNSQYNTVLQSTEQTTDVDRRYFRIEMTPVETAAPQQPNREHPEPLATQEEIVPTGEYSLIQTAPDQEMEASRRDSQPHMTPGVITRPQWTQSIPEETRDKGRQYSVVPEHTTGLAGQYCVVQTAPGCEVTTEPIETRTSVSGQQRKQKALLYAEVGFQEGNGLRPSILGSERVEYAQLDISTVAQHSAPTMVQQHYIDSSVGLDQILIQLREVYPHWRRLGEAVGLTTLDEINEYVGGSESEAMVEVVDGWLAKLHPDKPTWREIADVVDTIGHHDLANSLRQAYISGVLPVEVSNAVPGSLMFQNEPPPLIPTREPNDSKSSQAEPPPIPLRTYSTP